MTIWPLVTLAKDLLASTEAPQHIQKKKTSGTKGNGKTKMFRCSQRSYHRILSTDSKVVTTFQESIFFTQEMKGLTFTNVMLHCSLTLL